MLKICSICHRISGNNQDHLHCIEKRRVELENDDLKRSIPEKLDISKNSNDLGLEVKAILDHITREKEDG